MDIASIVLGWLLGLFTMMIIGVIFLKRKVSKAKSMLLNLDIEGITGEIKKLKKKDKVG